MSRFTLLSAIAPLTLGLLLVACSDEGEDTTTTTTVGVGGGTTTSSSGGAGQGGATTGNGGGGAGQGGGAGTGGTGTGGGGTGGAPAFGPCHGVVEDFDGFVVASTTDAWETDDVVALSNGMDKALLAQPDMDNYAGLFSATPAIAENCFFSIAVENAQQEPGFYILEVLEQGDTGRKLEIGVTPGAFSIDNILNAMGDGDNLGTGTITGDLRGMRIQILPTEVIFEVKDMTGWHIGATLTNAPAWLSSPVLLGFGYRSINAGEEGRFDDFSVEAPL